MAITSSIGYGGPVYDTEIPTWAKALGGLDYTVFDETSWKVTAVGAAARTVQVAAGTGAGRGITDASDGTGDTVVLPNPASGSLWHLIVARRTAGDAETTFTYCPGATTPEAAIALRSTFESTAGAEDDQPLALVRVTKDTSPVQGLIDVRCWQANGGLYGAHEHVRLYLSRPGTQVMIGTDLWTYAVQASGTGSEWRRTPLLQPLNLLAAGGALAPAGGSMPTGATVYFQAGSNVNMTDAAGYARVTFPVPFPNGLLTVVVGNGDQSVDRLVGETLSMGVAGHPWHIGQRDFFVYGVERPRSTWPNLHTGGLRHRVNWFAIGW